MQLLRAPAAASLGASRSTAFRSSSAFRPRAALRRRACAATTRAANQDDSFRAGSASSLSAGEAMKLLGLRESASAEEIVAAKNISIGRNPDASHVQRVEAAYDVLLMASLSKRRQGSGVPDSVRYADAKAAAPRSPLPLPPQLGDLGTQAAASAKAMMPSVGATPDARTLQLQGGVFAAAAVWALAIGASHTLGAPDVAPGPPLALGVGAAVYFLRQKGLPLPRAAGLAALGLLAGTVVGTAAQGALHVDIVPLGFLSSPAVLVSEFSLMGAFAAAAFLL